MFASTDKLPTWPVYIAIGVAIVIGIGRMIAHFVRRTPEAKIFPKLSFRRRLYAPYSGGNCAKISFRARRDA